MFNNNKVNMIISLLCAIALWFYVVGQVDPKTEKKISDVPIEFINEDSLTDNGLAVSAMDFDTATVTLEGNRADLNRIDKDNIRITADLICVACGIALYILGGGSWTRIGVIAGIGTVITAFFMGPLIDFFRVHVTDPMVQPQV